MCENIFPNRRLGLVYTRTVCISLYARSLALSTTDLYREDTNAPSMVGTGEPYRTWSWGGKSQTATNFECIVPKIFKILI